MKNLFNLNKAFLFMGIIICSLASCKNSDAKPEDTKDVATDKNEAQLDQVASEDDEATFFVDIAEMDLTEIKLAELAQQKATNLKVKEFAKMIVTDHANSSVELKNLADNRSLSLPTSLTDNGRADYNTLNEESGIDFDKKFVDMMVDAHEKAIRKMENASEDNDKDETVKVWASNKIAALTSHLQKAKMLKEDLDKK
ncbi:MAG: DUF4142 domain-containing protein [Flavobacterium sp.]